MNLNLKNKNEIVCASSQGLGKEAAVDLAIEGVNLAICSRDQKKIDRAKKDILMKTDQNIKILSLEVNLDSPEEINAFYKEVESTLGSDDILVNNTGGPPPSSFEQISDEDWLNAFNSTMMSSVRLSRAVIPHMKENNWGVLLISLQYQ